MSRSSGDAMAARRRPPHLRVIEGGGEGPSRNPLDRLPDVRDGLTRIERIVLWQIAELQKELDGRNVPTAMLYGRVVEHVDLSVDELTRVLQRLMGKPPTGGG